MHSDRLHYQLVHTFTEAEKRLLKSERPFRLHRCNDVTSMLRVEGVEAGRETTLRQVVPPAAVFWLVYSLGARCPR